MCRIMQNALLKQVHQGAEKCSCVETRNKKRGSAQTENNSALALQASHQAEHLVA